MSLGLSSLNLEKFRPLIAEKFPEARGQEAGRGRVSRKQRVSLIKPTQVKEVRDSRAGWLHSVLSLYQTAHPKLIQAGCVGFEGQLAGF